MLVVKRIPVTYQLSAETDADRETIDRVLGVHADYFPVARSIADSIEITTSPEFVG